MKSNLLLLAALLFDLALPGYRFQFPRDHFSHPNFQTEWWYYTGNLKTRAGRRFGFELTFFRKAVARPAARTTAWDVDDLYLAHLALSDIDGQRFYATERLNRAGPGLAGASLAEGPPTGASPVGGSPAPAPLAGASLPGGSPAPAPLAGASLPGGSPAPAPLAGAPLPGASPAGGRIWNGNWQALWSGDRQRLQAVAADFSFTLDLDPWKPPVIHGRDGVSRKSKGRGEASHYISFTRLAAAGAILLGGERHEVSGTAWMDHEFFTHQLASGQVGWDWLSIQLDNSTELMLYRLRRQDGTADPYSAGTFIDRDGRSRHLDLQDFSLEPLETWTSPATGARYPIHWKIRVPSLALELDCATPLAAQELLGHSPGSPNYWEGAVTYRGRAGAAPVTGVGYLEMTGYDRPLRLE